MVINNSYNPYSIYIKSARNGSFIGEGPTTTIKLILIVILHVSIPNTPLKVSNNEYSNVSQYSEVNVAIPKNTFTKHRM